MNSISSIIQTLTLEEKRSFITQLKQKNKRNDTKNIQLFKLFDSNEEVKNPDQVIYGKKSKGAFHALCKRLHDSLIDFIASKSFEGETSEEMEILKLLLSSRIFFEQKQYKIALKTIRKAEHKARKYDLFSILNEIYYTKIQYAHVNDKKSLHELIYDFNQNRKQFHQEENLNLFYATVQNELSKNTVDFESIIKATLVKFDISLTKDLTFRSLFKILEITNKTAYITRNYHTILPFVTEAYQQIESKNDLTEKHLFYHIQILYYVANVYFRNKQFETSQRYLDLMLSQMKKQRHKYYKRFLPQYTLLQTLNLNYSGQTEAAIPILEQFDYKKHKDQITYTLDLKLTLIVFYFQQSRCKDALRIFREFYHSDIWYTEKAGLLWVIKKNLVEILLHLELNNIDLVESRLNSFRKKHNSYLKNNSETRVLEFLKLVTEFHKNPKAITAEKYKEKVKNTLSSLEPEQEDIFDLSVYAWLKAKINNDQLYTTTLSLINRSQQIQ
ncbi:hypothetical protein [Aquimarina sp. MMG016]|uniref:hypothetical protein n=1 Tax=Aquimarina sp. MMG016 TaxID=2822690 RepID=UPI001B39FA67|nr:hypothetical protein [Aquimarina sp. MMG016]MBQ4822903.1 hypothetical protein [Aquimarina sp. MMG016]